MSGLRISAALILAAAIARGLLRMIAGYQSEAVGQHVGYDLRLAYFEKLQRLGFDFHDRIHSGDLVTAAYSIWRVCAASSARGCNGSCW